MSIHFSDEERVARIYYEELEFGKRTFGRVVERARELGLEGWHEKKVRRALDSLEENGMIVHQVLIEDSTVLPPPRRWDLEGKVLGRYETLDDIQVIQSLATDDDQLLQHLGAYGASLLLSSVRATDSLGIGSGRGAHYTCTYLDRRLSGRKDKKKLPLERLLSLSGDMSESENAQGLKHKYYDADENVSVLMNRFRPRLKIRVNLPLFSSQQSSRSAAPNLLAKTTLVVVGVGALGPGHRVYTPDTDELRNVEALLEKINGLAEHVQASVGGDYCAVGDICNYFFVVPPPPGATSAVVRELRRLGGLLKSLNQHSSGRRPTLDQIAEVASKDNGKVVAVAGGKGKRHILRYLISSKDRVITHLVTDSDTAQWLADVGPYPS